MIPEAAVEAAERGGYTCPSECAATHPGREHETMIPDAAVEAACNSFWYDSDNGKVYEEEVRAALEAAAPHLMAQAWDEALAFREANGWTEQNPYRKATK